MTVTRRLRIYRGGVTCPMNERGKLQHLGARGAVLEGMASTTQGQYLVCLNEAAYEAKPQDTGWVWELEPVDIEVEAIYSTPEQSQSREAATVELRFPTKRAMPDGSTTADDGGLFFRLMRFTKTASIEHKAAPKEIGGDPPALRFTFGWADMERVRAFLTAELEKGGRVTLTAVPGGRDTPGGRTK